MQINEHESQKSLKKQKTKDDYSRNVKKLKLKLEKISNQIQGYEQKLKKLQNTSNDQIISMKISKFCKERKFTPEILFRFADVNCKNLVTRMQFRNTLISIGLKLSQQELTRLEYLLDEDIKGDISLLEYSKYLHAFGLKTEHNPDDPFVKQTLKNIDFNKLLDIAKQEKTKQKKKDSGRILLTYEQFLKYCHKHFPEMKDKELAKIFKLLEHDEIIDLDDFIEYLENLKKQQERINNKNKENKKPEDQTKKKVVLSEEQQKIDIDTLKGKLMAVLKEHPQKQQTFHSSQFKRVQLQYKLKKGIMLTLFREMDSKMAGSVTFDEIIVFYVDQQTYKPNNQILIKYSFILMGKKLLSVGEKPETLIATFAKEETFITLDQFIKLCQIQFSLREEMAKRLYEVLLNCHGQKIKDGCVNIALLISLMKINRYGIKNNIRPILQDEYKKFLYKKHYQTICTNGIVAYKICESIVNQLAESQKYEKWDDLEFGPSTEDQNGLDSISRNISNPNIKWHRTSNLNMKDFYLPANKDSTLYSLSSVCVNDLFYKSLQTLIKYNPACLYRKSSQILKNSKKVEESELLKLFQGIHPLAFHRFQERGIYVIQFFLRNKWVYVIIDDKIPCSLENEPLFARTANDTCSFIPLIQKAYAKLKGSYEKIFEFPSLSKYINELSSNLVHSALIQDSLQQKDSKNISKLLTTVANVQAQKKQLERIKQQKVTSTQLYLANLTIPENKTRNLQKLGLSPNSLVQIFFSTQIKDDRNPSTIHNLTFVNCPYPINAEEKWNTQWHQKSSVFRRHQPLIKAQINKWDNENEFCKLFKNGRLQTIVMDIESIKQNFNSFVQMTYFKFDDSSVLLRKEVEFEKNFSCLYKINSTDKSKEIKLVVALNKLRAPNDARISVSLKNISQNDTKSEQTQSRTVRGEFGCMSFSVPQTEHDLQIKVEKFEPDQQYIYQLSFYFENPRYSLKQRDRHLLFRYVSQYEERSKLEFDFLTENQKKYFYQHFFLNANRKGFLCC